VKLYRVVVTPEAQTGIVEGFQFIHEHSQMNAAKWLRALYRKIETLESMPGRCALARENEYFDETLRQLVFQSHRIVVWVRHGKQRAIGELDG
jgi:plasmid stabilization system protein ParE